MPADHAFLITWAQVIGTHALPVFLSVLTALVVAAGAISVIVHRRHSDGGVRPAEAVSLRRLLLTIGVGFIVILAAASLFAAIAEGLEAEHVMGAADQALTDAIARTVPPATLRVFEWLTHLGDPLTLVVLGVLVAGLLWQRRERVLAVGWTVALIGGGLLNTLLKQVFERVRPVHDDALYQATGYSFPSGHAAGAMVGYGMLMYVALRLLPIRWHPLAAMVAVAIIWNVACSRIFLRVHFASDVAAGLLSGLCWTAVCIAALALARHRQARQPE